MKRICVYAHKIWQKICYTRCLIIGVPDDYPNYDQRAKNIQFVKIFFLFHNFTLLFIDFKQFFAIRGKRVELFAKARRIHFGGKLFII